MRFSQRIGKKDIKVNFQTEDIDKELKIRLWNIVNTTYSTFNNDDAIRFFKVMWINFFIKPVNLIPVGIFGNTTPIECKEFLYEWFFKCEWYEIYDLLEYLVGTGNFKFRSSFADDCNQALEMEVSSYRILNQKVVRINSELEIESIQQAIDESDGSHSVNTHLKAALDLLSNRTNPDYRNSIKESISALEAFCKKIIGDDKATLGKVLTVLEKKHGLHPALKTSFTSLYGYTSDTSGIRHALTDDDKKVISFEEAKYILVSCSTFINYLKSLDLES